MSSTAHDGTMGADGLRSRLPNDPANPRQATSTESAQAAVKTLNDEEEKTGKAEHEKRTYGRTPDGKGALNHTSIHIRFEKRTILFPESSIEVATILNINLALHCIQLLSCLLYTSPSPRDRTRSRMPSSA